MKATRYLFTFLVLAMLALTACHNDDLPGGNTLPEGAVHITADIEGVQTRAPQLDADGAGSFEPADEWGMYTCNLQIFLCLFLEKLNMPQNTPVTKAS